VVGRLYLEMESAPEISVLFFVGSAQQDSDLGQSVPQGMARTGSMSTLQNESGNCPSYFL